MWRVLNFRGWCFTFRNFAKIHVPFLHIGINNLPILLLNEPFFLEVPLSAAKVRFCHLQIVRSTRPLFFPWHCNTVSPMTVTSRTAYGLQRQSLLFSTHDSIADFRPITLNLPKPLECLIQLTTTSSSTHQPCILGKQCSDCVRYCSRLCSTIRRSSSPLWKRAVAWDGSPCASAYGIVWGGAQVGHLELCPST